MKKNLLLRLCLMMAVGLALCSCSNEELYSSSEKEKQEIISKSLWKEDALFTQRIYDHFQKSFMATETDQQKFYAEYGTPQWEYTMTMGFKRNQLYVPLLRNNLVTGMMKVERQDKNAYYSFTQDSEAVAFFEIVMYNPHHYELQPQKDQKLNNETSAKAGYTWTCTKRIVISGYHMEGDMMVMESSALDICKYTYTGMKPPVDHISVFTDGMESGGGGDEQDEEEEYEGSPCEKLKLQNVNTNYKNKIKALDKPSVFNQDYESGYSEDKNGNFTELSVAEKTEGSNSLKIPLTANVKGYTHAHLNDKTTGNTNLDGGQEKILHIRMFSPGDVSFLMDMAQLQTDGNYEDLYGTMVSSYGNYTIKFTGTSADIKTGFDTEKWKDKYREYRDSNKEMSFEKLFLTFLRDQMQVEGVSLYKIKDNGTVQQKTLNANNTVNTVECPK